MNKLEPGFRTGDLYMVIGQTQKVEYKPTRYVVLENFKGQRFWTTNNHNSYSNTHSIECELWYKEIAFTDDMNEAQRLCGYRG